MKVLIVSQWYDPEPIPKPGELARELVARGHEVEVLTGLPYYPNSRVKAGYWRKSWRAESVAGVRIVRAPEFPYHGRSAPLRVLSYLTFLVTAWLASFRLTRPDVVYAWHPPTTVGVLALHIARRYGVGLVHDIQDVWPEVIASEARDGIVARGIRRLERRVRRGAAVVITPTDAGRRLVLESAPSTRVLVAPHWGKEAPLPAPARASKQGFRVLFAGNIGAVQGLDAPIRAAALLRDRGLELVILGDGSEKARLEALAHELGAPNVRFEGRVPADEAARRMQEADVLLIGVRPGRWNQTILPTKLVSYAAAGRPLLAYGGTAAGDLIEAADAGWAVEGHDVEELRNAFERAMTETEPDRQRRGKAARDLYLQRFRFSAVIDQYVGILQDVASRRASGAT